MDKNTAAMATPASMGNDNLKHPDPEDSLHLEHIESRPADPEAPCNWPRWKKNAQIAMVAFHSMMSTFMAAGIVPAYEVMAEEYHITVTEATYLTSIQVGLCILVTLDPQSG